MSSSRRCALRWAFISVVTLSTSAAAVPAWACACGLLADGAGIRVSVADTRPEVLEADLDLTMYTRIPDTFSPRAGASALGPNATAGTPFYGIPALDYGDGSTLPTTTLALASTGGGPGGSNAYRSLASFTHTYPGVGNYTVTAGMFCTACTRYRYSAAPTTAPSTPTFVTTYDLLPTIVVGNLVLPYSYTYTTTSESYVLRYAYTFYAAITNTALVVMPAVVAVPVATTWGLMLLGALLAGGGLLVLRRG